MASTKGSISRPDWVGVLPFTICRYWGIIAIPPNIAMPTTRPVSEVRLNTELRNSRSGMSASSLAKCSATTKAIRPIAPTT